MDELTIQSRLRSLGPTESLKPKDKLDPSQKGDLPSFNEVLKNAIKDVNQLQADADKVVKDIQLGKDVDIHQAMIALNKMEVSFKVLMEVRDKILTAYQEVMRTQV